MGRLLVPAEEFIDNGQLQQRHQLPASGEPSPGSPVALLVGGGMEELGHEGEKKGWAAESACVRRGLPSTLHQACEGKQPSESGRRQAKGHMEQFEGRGGANRGNQEGVALVGRAVAWLVIAGGGAAVRHDAERPSPCGPRTHAPPPPLQLAAQASWGGWSGMGVRRCNNSSAFGRRRRKAG